MKDFKKRNYSRVSPQVIPVGIEKVLYIAATDPEFRKRLFSDREAALGDMRVDLDPSERTILNGVQQEQLALMIDRIDIESHSRRGFIATVAAATAGLALVMLQEGCPSTGSLHDGGWYPDAGRDAGKSLGGRLVTDRCDCQDNQEGDCDCNEPDEEQTNEIENNEAEQGGVSK